MKPETLRTFGRQCAIDGRSSEEVKIATAKAGCSDEETSIAVRSLSHKLAEMDRLEKMMMEMG